MPLPKRKVNEKVKDFIPRCIEQVKGEFPDRKQAVAVCYTLLKKKA